MCKFHFPFNIDLYVVVLEYVEATSISTSCIKIYVHYIVKVEEQKN